MVAHYLLGLSSQDQVDYVNVAQQRVAADTLALETKTTLDLTADVYVYELPADLVELEGIYNDAIPLDDLTMDELMTTLSGVGASNYLGPQGYAIVGRSLYVLPIPAGADTLTIVYYQRPPPFTSEDDLSVDGSEMELVEALFDGYVAFDRGETEVGSSIMGRYMADAQRVRAINRGPAGPRIPVLGPRDRFR